MDSTEQLKLLAENDNIEPADVWDAIKEYMTIRERKKYLDNHKYRITQAADGRWFTRLPVKPTGSKVVAFRTKQEAEDGIVQFYKEGDNNPTLRELFEMATNERMDEGSITQSTVTRNKADFNRFYVEYGEQRIKSVTLEDIERFIRQQKKEHQLNAKAYSNLISTTRSIFRYAKKKKYTDLRIDEVLEDIDWGKNAFRQEESDDSKEVFNDAEIEVLTQYLLSRPTGKHLGLLLCFATGLRIGELSALMWSDVTDEEILVHRTETKWTDDDGHVHVEVRNLPKTKAGKRVVPIPSDSQWLIQALRELNPKGQYVFMLNGNRTQTVYFRKALYNACDAVHIPRRSPHKIRKTYASILLDNGVTDKFVTEVMGHTDIRTTNGSYARRRRSAEQRLQVVDSIPEFQLIARK